MSSKSSNTESKISFLNTNDNLLNNNLVNEEERKNYYKNILSNYKNFREFLPEGKEELYNNLKKYKKEFFFIQNYFTNTILIIDGENLLKSSKFQNIFKIFLGTDEFNNLYKHWFYGSEDKTIQPFASLNMNIKQKKNILSKFSELYLDKFNNIFIINTKYIYENDIIFTNDNKSIILPIYYENTEIREQDDHIIVFLNNFFDNNNRKTHIISADKFKWYKEQLSLKNFRFIYDYDNISIYVDISYNNSHDIIIYKNNKIIIDNFNYPFLDPKNFKIIQVTDYKNLSLQNISYILNFLYMQIKIDNKEYFLKYIDNIVNIILVHAFKNKEELEKMLLLLLNNKKIDKKIVSKFNLAEIETNIKNYKSICNIYLILKGISILYNPKNYILNICKIFCYIIDIFDIINDNLNKIKKISYENTFIINKYCLDLYSHHIYLKKNGFLKKDII
jgi:hypothetical protein